MSPVLLSASGAREKVSVEEDKPLSSLDVPHFVQYPCLLLLCDMQLWAVYHRFVAAA